MALSSRDVAQVACRNGHSIVSIQKVAAIDPNSKLVIPVFEVLCSKCGLSLPDIRKGFRGSNKSSQKE